MVKLSTHFRNESGGALDNGTSMPADSFPLLKRESKHFLQTLQILLSCFGTAPLCFRHELQKENPQDEHPLC